MGEVEGGEGGKGEPGAEGRPVEEGDALSRHLIIIGVRCAVHCIKSDRLAVCQS